MLPARLAADIVRSLGAGKVEVAVDGDDVQHHRWSLAVQRAAAVVRRLPEAGDADHHRRSRCRRPRVGEALRQVVRAASTDEARPILTGVLLTAENDGLRMVATDSYRLAVRDLAEHAGARRRPEGARARAGAQRAAAPGRRRRRAHDATR